MDTFIQTLLELQLYSVVQLTENNLLAFIVIE